METVRVLCAEPYWTEPALDFIRRLRRSLGAGREAPNNSRFNRLKSRRTRSSREASVPFSTESESIRVVFLEFVNDRTARVSEIERLSRCRYRKPGRKVPHEIPPRAGRAEVRARSVGATAREDGLTSRDGLGQSMAWAALTHAHAMPGTEWEFRSPAQGEVFVSRSFCECRSYFLALLAVLLLAVVFFAADLFGAARLAVVFFAVVLLAVVFFLAVDFFGAARLAVVFFAVVLLAVVFLVAVFLFAVDFFGAARFAAGLFVAIGSASSLGSTGTARDLRKPNEHPYLFNHNYTLR